MKRIAVVFGTRPEAVKLAPVVHGLRAAPDLEPRLIVTAQHREMLDQMLAVFGLVPDVDLNLMTPGQGLAELTARALTALDGVFEAERPDYVLVQGDTTTVLAGALAAFYRGIPVGHVEAGLRTRDPRDPFPEEINRRLTGGLARLHFAPTPRARANLLAEGVEAERIHLTGNTGVDALQWMLARLPAQDDAAVGRRLLLMTAHRRENWGEPLERICAAVRRVLDARPDTRLAFPMHRNPLVRATAERHLGSHPRASLSEPADYPTMVGLMRQAHLMLTDSGGLQEEAPALGLPVLVLRETTERPEAIEAGCARLVGTDGAALERHLLELLDDEAARQRMARVANPFGDGRAAERIVALLRADLGLKNT